MDSDLAWVNGKSGRQSWRYHADSLQRSIGLISEAIYHFTIYLYRADEMLNSVRLYVYHARTIYSTQARGSSACMKAPSENTYGKSTQWT